MRKVVLTHICSENSVPVVCILLLTSSIFIGCEDISRTWNDYYYQGTNIGYQQCVERNKGMELSEETVHSQCLSKHEKSVSGSIGADGKAEYVRYFGITRFDVSIKNTFADKIITSFSIWIKHKENVDSDGKPITEILHFKKVWIEPNQTKDVVFFDIKFTPNLDIDQHDLFQWNISEIGRLKIVLR